MHVAYCKFFIKRTSHESIANKKQKLRTQNYGKRQRIPFFYWKKGRRGQLALATPSGYYYKDRTPGRECSL
ncbi:hypothetical protein EUGRSUZ_H01194 [Eucalyptus grandis]|uniref:Uncharacterized protein n=2 Tax=Eucalyptus grandis TaxID=71139 RepID=A0ACC3JNJ5_EUCGR|nr:hypothetical protein EUGRSUZ_H01194 [Eucalyptus grandis]